jgi:hypothetical protein
MSDGPDREATAEEVAEAAALAEALERGPSAGAALAPPTDALEAAALLRLGRDGGALPADRQRAVLADLLPVVARRRARRWRWLALPTAAALAAAAALFFSLQLHSRPQPVTRRLVPSVALLHAQAEATRPGGGAEPLERQMQTYRERMLAALAERYRGRP